MGSVFDGDFMINTLKAADGGRFADRGNKTRLAFILHTDFFNPNGSTHRGPHHSIGIISAANLALPPSIRYLPEYMFVAAIIPGPREPPQEESDHYLKPVIEQFVEAWKPGFFITPTAQASGNEKAPSEGGSVVECALTISLNDLPAARKFCGFAGSNSNFLCTLCKLFGRQNVWNTRFDTWKRRDPKALRELAEMWRDAATSEERRRLFKKNGVRWSSFWLLPYWDSTVMLVVDAMHALLEGLVQYECREVLRLDAATLQKKKSSDGTAYAFRHAWDPPDTLYSDTLRDDHLAEIPKVQAILELAIEGKNSITLQEMWKKLENKPLAALKAVALSLQMIPTSFEGDMIIDIDDESDGSASDDGMDTEKTIGQSGAQKRASALDQQFQVEVILEPEVEQAYLGRLRAKNLKVLPKERKTMTINEKTKVKAPFIAFLLNWVSAQLLGLPKIGNN
jgi:hypothetical protein